MEKKGGARPKRMYILVFAGVERTCADALHFTFSESFSEFLVFSLVFSVWTYSRQLSSRRLNPNCVPVSPEPKYIRLKLNYDSESFIPVCEKQTFGASTGN